MSFNVDCEKAFKDAMTALSVVKTTHENEQKQYQRVISKQAIIIRNQRIRLESQQNFLKTNDNDIKRARMTICNLKKYIAILENQQLKIRGVKRNRDDESESDTDDETETESETESESESNSNDSDFVDSEQQENSYETIKPFKLDVRTPFWQLMQINRIGKKLSRDIVRFIRNNNGIKSFDELLKIPRINEGIVNLIREYFYI